jgi:MFS family permease
MGTASSIATVIGFSFLGGVGNGIEGGALMTLIQQHAPDREQSDLNCLLESLHSCGPGLGYLLGGVIAPASSPRDSYVIASIGGLAALVMLTRGVALGAPRQPAPSPS